MELIMVCAWILTISYALLLLLYGITWIRMPVFIPNRGFRPSTMVSIVVAARNEENNIIRLLDCLLNQEYPKELLEIIIIDDASADNTVSQINQYIKQKGNGTIRLIPLQEVPGIRSGKKRALTEGIKNAKGKLIVTTDADCTMGSGWLLSIVAYFEKHTPVFIASPVFFYDGEQFLEKFQELEFTGLMGTTGASISLGHPLMCNGANLAFTKDIFNHVNGYEGTEQTPSGDDVFLMQKIYHLHKKGIVFLKSPEAIVYTKAKSTWKTFLSQRKRWVSKSGYYRNAGLILTSLLVMSVNLMVILFLALSMWNQALVAWFGVLIGIKLSVDFLFLFLTTGFFKKRSLLFLFFPAQVFNYFYIPVATLGGLWGKNEWKGRRF